MKNHELISEEEWYRRCLEDDDYTVVSFNWEKGIIRVLEKESGIMYDVTSKTVGNKLMLVVVEVD